MIQRGFTLIELLVVITIIAAMAGVAMVALPDGNPAKALRQEAQRFSDEFAIVQNKAAAEQRVYGLTINNDGFQFHIVEDWTDGDGIRPSEPIWQEGNEFDWRQNVRLSGPVTGGRTTPKVIILPDGFYQPDFEIAFSSDVRCSGADFNIVGNGYNAPQVISNDC